MLPIGRYVRIGLALGLCAMLPATGAAADLQTPTIAASVAAAADWATTYHALKNYRVREMNPVLSPFERTPATMITLGAAIDASLVSGWNLTMGKNHPKVAAGGLWAMTAFRVYLAAHNLRNERKAARRGR